MKSNKNLTIRHLAPCLMTAILAYASPAIAVDAPYFTMDLPAGLACSDFDLRIEGWGGHHQRVSRDFYDKDGNKLRGIGAGTGDALRFTNLGTGETLSTASNGAVMRNTFHPDGTIMATGTGHNVIIMFPTDFPPGPSTTLYAGQVVFTIDGRGDYRILKETGKKTDICAALSD